MTETEVAATPAAAASPAKAKAKAKAKPAARPSAAKMVLAAITNLKERNGSSLQAIKKYIGVNFKCDVAKLSVFIRKALVNGVEKGTFTQCKGTGASGSFKLAVKEAAPKKAKTAAGAKKTTVAPKSPAGQKKKKAKAGAAKKDGAVKATATATPKKQKATKSSKAVAAKQPKTPKPKKATPAKKKTAAKK